MIRLHELFVDGFGCLRAPDAPFRFVPDRITLFLDDNEAGKTTLQMALVASLYGIETDKRLLRTSLRPHGTHWFPLGGPPFGTRLRIHDGRRLIEIRWDFADAGAVGIVDLESNTDITEQWCPNGDGLALGRRLLDLSAGEFSKTCLVAQDDLASVGRAAGLDSLVQRAADSQAGDATVARALTALRDTMRNYPEGVMLKGGSLENEIKRLVEEAKELHRQLEELDADHQAIADQDAEFRRLIAERDELRGHEARLDYLAQVAEHVELEERIAAVRQTQAELARLVGCSEENITAIENERNRQPGPELVAGLSRALDLPVEDIYAAIAGTLNHLPWERVGDLDLRDPELELMFRQVDSLLDGEARERVKAFIRFTLDEERRRLRREKSEKQH